VDLTAHSLFPLNEVIVHYTYRAVDVVPVSCMFTLGTQCARGERISNMSAASPLARAARDAYAASAPRAHAASKNRALARESDGSIVVPGAPTGLPQSSHLMRCASHDW